MLQRHVIVPAPINLVNLSTGKPLMQRMVLANGRVVDTDKEQEPFTLWRMVVEVILADNRLGAGWKAALIVKALIEGFQHAAPGAVVPIAQEHWEKIKDILDSPSAGVDPTVNGQITSMYRAFLDAKDTPPEDL